mmetsp:Transcript_831/g.2582  ORF Transcript_831/g.2582 Transcript_831/m.2582 type:complete len:247 (+) Transcript_831:654-1394(+)
MPPCAPISATLLCLLRRVLWRRRLLPAERAADPLRDLVGEEDDKYANPLRSRHVVAKPEDGEEHAHELADRRDLGHRQRAKVVLQLEDEDVARRHRARKDGHLLEHGRVLCDKRQALRQLAGRRDEDEREEALPDVHVQHQVKLGHLVLVRNPVLVRAIDAVAHEREEDEDEADDRLAVELEGLRALLGGGGEREHDHAKREQQHRHALRRRVLDARDDDLARHHRDRLARLDDDLQREDDVLERL